MLNDKPRSHRQAWELIPWLVNGTASEPERRLAEAHIRECDDCREELVFQEQLRAGLARQMPQEGGEAEGWKALQSRLNAAVPADEMPRRDPAAHRPSWTAWLVAAVLVQAVGLAALGLALSSHARSAPPTYRTLAAAEASVPAGAVRVVFEPRMTLAQLQVLLARTGLRVLSGPGLAGVWTLAPTSPPRDAAALAVGSQVLGALRADPAVRLAVMAGAEP